MLYLSRVITAPSPLWVPPTMMYAGAASGVLESADTASAKVAVSSHERLQNNEIAKQKNEDDDDEVKRAHSCRAGCCG